MFTAAQARIFTDLRSRSNQDLLNLTDCSANTALDMIGGAFARFNRGLTMALADHNVIKVVETLTKAGYRIEDLGHHVVVVHIPNIV